jgi:hypothetical protein
MEGKGSGCPGPFLSGSVAKASDGWRRRTSLFRKCDRRGLHSPHLFAILGFIILVMQLLD